jgi:hypothetical protein
VIAAVRQLALIANDDVIAGILNRNGLVTGYGNRWTRERVTSLRSHHRIAVYKAADNGIEPWLNLSKAAQLLHVSPRTLRLAAQAGEIEAIHPLPDGPWIFSRPALSTASARAVTERARQNPKYPTGSHPDQISVPVNAALVNWLPWSVLKMSWLAKTRECLCQGRDAERAVHSVGQPPSQHRPARPGHDRHEVKEAAADRDVGDIGAPDLVRSIDAESAPADTGISCALAPASSSAASGRARQCRSCASAAAPACG